MSEMYRIYTNDLKVDSVITQLRAIKDYPAIVNIYDRTIKISTADECHMMISGLEIGQYLTEELFEKNK